MLFSTSYNLKFTVSSLFVALAGKGSFSTTQFPFRGDFSGVLSSSNSRKIYAKHSLYCACSLYQTNFYVFFMNGS